MAIRFKNEPCLCNESYINNYRVFKGDKVILVLNGGAKNPAMTYEELGVIESVSAKEISLRIERENKVVRIPISRIVDFTKCMPGVY